MYRRFSHVFHKPLSHNALRFPGKQYSHCIHPKTPVLARKTPYFTLQHWLFCVPTLTILHSNIDYFAVQHWLSCTPTLTILHSASIKNRLSAPHPTFHHIENHDFPLSRFFTQRLGFCAFWEHISPHSPSDNLPCRNVKTRPYCQNRLSQRSMSGRSVHRVWTVNNHRSRQNCIFLITFRKITTKSLKSFAKWNLFQ